MSEKVVLTVERGGERLDQALAALLPGLSRMQAKRLIQAAAVTVNGEPCKPAYRVMPGDRLEVELPKAEEPAIRPESIPLSLVYEDAYLLAVDKPAGLVVHPGAGHETGTLVHALLARYPEVIDVGGVGRGGIVHRLDKETSGLLLVARDAATHAALQRQFKRRQVSKTYLALVEDRVEPREGIIEAPIGRSKRERKRMAVLHSGRPAVTQYRVLRIFRGYTLLEVRPHTGRTHQVRVHLAWLGYPVVGDRVYGRQRQPLLPHRHFLHASRLAFVHPVTGEKLELEAPLPPELEEVLTMINEQ